MSRLLRVWAIFLVAVKRLLSQRWLALATALGLTTSVALTVSVPLYADAVYYRVLREELSAGSSGELTARSPLGLVFRYVGGWEDSSQWEDVQPVDAYLSGPAGSALGLPQKFAVRYFETGKFALFSQEDAYARNRAALTWSAFGFASDLEGHITILEGSFPAGATPSRDSTVEVLVTEALALELGLQVGEAYVVVARPRAPEKAEQTTEIPVRIAGVWKATNSQEEFWFYDQTAFDDVMLVPEETFRDRISPNLEDEVYVGLWYLVMDGTNIHPSSVASLLVQITAVQQRTAGLLPGTKLAISPADALQRYRVAAGLLTILLYAFSMPILGLILAFIGLVAGLAVRRRRNEIAVLRSRGGTVIQIMGIAALEGLLMGVVALAIGLPAGRLIAHLIGRTRSFLEFTLQSDLRVAMTPAVICFGVIAVGLTTLVQVASTIGAARHTIVTYKQERARTMRSPWWQRACLDVLLLIPAAYGTYLLRQQGAIVVPLANGTAANDPFQNPLLFLVPALGILALTLFILRILPTVVAAIAWVASRTRGVGILLATRHLSRTPGFYAAPLVLLVLTLSLSVFTASLAQTLDNHLHDQTHYRVGADANVARIIPAPPIPEGVIIERKGFWPWIFLPISEFLKVPGVQAAARIGRYDALTRLSGGVQEGIFIGIDRVDFSEVAFWRQDFAPVHLRVLVNALAIHPDGVLVPRDLIARHGLNVGDTFRATIRMRIPPGTDRGELYDLDLKVVGGFDLFPSWYSQEDGPLLVGNLDYLFQEVGGRFAPQRVWLKIDPNVEHDQVMKDIGDMNLGVSDLSPSLVRIYEEQRRPERQGLFGVLSVGFIASALLTVLGFLLYAFFSFRRRFIELGVLRAIGLSTGQMTTFLACELAFLILVGLVAGTGLGVWVSKLFVPYLQVGTGPSAYTPPFVVEIAWLAIFRVYVLFGLLFVAALGGLATLLMRMKIFQAVKLGETA